MDICSYCSNVIITLVEYMEGFHVDTVFLKHVMRDFRKSGICVMFLVLWFIAQLGGSKYLLFKHFLFLLLLNFFIHRPFCYSIFLYIGFVSWIIEVYDLLLFAYTCCTIE